MCSNLAGIEQFRGRTLIIATQHGKEKVIAPEFQNVLGVHCEVVPGLNTDQFGAFSGEVQRVGTALEAARKKAQAALKISGASMAVASEGSFGPHPYYPFIPGNEELLLFIDEEHELEISARHLTTETNYQQKRIERLEELDAFCETIGFSEHGVILKAKSPEGQEELFKELTDLSALTQQTQALFKKGYTVDIETDMRAMRNPTRMKAIAEVTTKLVEKLGSCCPACGSPGYAKIEFIEGLPCKLCRTPTRSIKAFIYGCPKCDHQEEVERSDKTHEEPMYCDVCNP